MIRITFLLMMCLSFGMHSSSACFAQDSDAVARVKRAAGIGQPPTQSQSQVDKMLDQTIEDQTGANSKFKATDFGLPKAASRRSGEPNEQRPDHIHEGIDFSTKGADGVLVSAVFTAGLGVTGRVIQAGGGKFNTIVVKLDNGNQMEYLHAGEVLVRVNQKVGPATRLGRTGNAGVKYIHLHIQAKDKWGHAINPDTARPRKFIQRIRPQAAKTGSHQGKGHWEINPAGPHPDGSGKYSPPAIWVPDK